MTQTYQEIKALIDTLLGAKPETGEQWAEICALEAKAKIAAEHLRLEAYAGEHRTKKLVGWRSVVYRVVRDANGMMPRSIEQVHDEQLAVDALGIINLDLFALSYPDDYFEVQLQPIFK